MYKIDEADVALAASNQMQFVWMSLCAYIQHCKYLLQPIVQLDQISLLQTPVRVHALGLDACCELTQ